MRLPLPSTLALLLVLAGCGNDATSSNPVEGGDAVRGDRAAMVEAIGTEPCDVFDDATLTRVIGATPAPEPSEPSGPFVGCSWNTGDVLVSLAIVGDQMILAPGEDECPSVGIGDESYQCEGQGVKFRIGAIQGRVSTISGFVVTDRILQELAQEMAESLES